MITSETQVKAFQKSLPLPSFRLKAPSSNPFLPSLPASVTGEGSRVEFSWRPQITVKEEQSSNLFEMVEKLQRQAERFPMSGAVRVNLVGCPEDIATTRGFVYGHQSISTEKV